MSKTFEKEFMGTKAVTKTKPTPNFEANLVTFNRSSSMVDNELIRMNHRKTDYSTITPSQMEGTRKVR